MFKKSKPILRFAGWWVVVYGLLITPWPGARQVYGGYFRCLGRLFFSAHDSQRVVEFQPLKDAEHRWPSNFDTAIILANRELADSGGQAQSCMLTLDAWQLGWVPTAFLLALTLATPIPWRRRIWGLGWGLVGVQGFVLLTLAIFIWNESTRLQLLTLTPFWKDVANRLEELALAPVGPSFFAATFIWLLVTFRHRDFTGNRAGLAALPAVAVRPKAIPR